MTECRGCGCQSCECPCGCGERDCPGGCYQPSPKTAENTEIYLKKRLKRHGNSLVLVIDKPILGLLGWDNTTMLKMSTDGKKLILERVKERKS